MNSIIRTHALSKTLVALAATATAFTGTAILASAQDPGIRSTGRSDAIGPSCHGYPGTVVLEWGDQPTEGPDVIIGTPFNDEIDGLGGDDIICGFGGDDFVTGGSGNDRIYLGAGNDLVNAGGGNDRVWGGSGDDALNGSEGDDILRGGPGADSLDGGLGVDKLYGGRGRDLCFVLNDWEVAKSCQLAPAGD